MTFLVRFLAAVLNAGTVTISDGRTVTFTHKANRETGRSMILVVTIDGREVEVIVADGCTMSHNGTKTPPFAVMFDGSDDPEVVEFPTPFLVAEMAARSLVAV